MISTARGSLGPGWRRFGIPPGGAMDRRASRQANRLLDNPPDCAVLECLQGTRLVVLETSGMPIFAPDEVVRSGEVRA